MLNNKKIFPKSALAACLLAGTSSAFAYGPLYVFDYENGIPYRWDVSSPVKVYTDGGNFASGTVKLYKSTPETCNEDDGWVCGHYEDVYVEFANEQGVARVKDALASWTKVPTSTFQAEVAGSFADIGIGGEDGDITGAAEEFTTDSAGNVVHEIIGTVNNGGIHVMFDETGSVMRDVMGAPPGVLGIASPEWADEETGIITEGWAVIGGASTYYNDTDLRQINGVITHELGHSFNLAHTQTNGHIIMYGNYDALTAGPRDCSAHPLIGGAYRLPFPQDSAPALSDISVMYPYINTNPTSSGATGDQQATATTQEDYAAISSLYPANSFTSQTGTIKGTVTYAFSKEGVIGLNIVARNIDDPWHDAITAMTGDWNDGDPEAAQGSGEFILQGLTPGAQYVIHVEKIFAGGFPTPQFGMPGPSEYYNGSGESDDAVQDDACDYVPVVAGAGQVVEHIDIQMNGMKNTPQLITSPAPNGNQVTESGQTTAGTIANSYGDALSWVYQDGNEDYTILPMGGIAMSDNGAVISGRVSQNSSYLPARYTQGRGIEVLPSAGNTGCDQGGGILEMYSNFAISPDGRTMGGFLWNCDNAAEYSNYRVSAVTYSDDDGWTILDSHKDDNSSRVNALSNTGVAVGWESDAVGWWEGRVWKNGEEINLQDAAPSDIEYVGQATAVSRDGTWVTGIDTYNAQLEPNQYLYNTETGEFRLLDIKEACPWWDWFCWGDKPFNPYDVADDGTLVGAIGTASGAGAMIVSDTLGGEYRLADFLRGQGVMNASDLEVVSTATKISTNGKHIVGWTALDGYFGSFKLTLDQLYVCNNDKTLKVGYPVGVATQLHNGAELGMCAADLPKQYK
ncbi:matrixin family metalloprotease [Microbulbifer sp. SAOS-129_SWC]|uniref:matrixin family metalloprotease n=1 Tax=Microbulbifer sp. SAOS-129_SWC TaxID=3145235 RepID=UPI00321716EB